MLSAPFLGSGGHQKGLPWGSDIACALSWEWKESFRESNSTHESLRWEGAEDVLGTERRLGHNGQEPSDGSGCHLRVAERRLRRRVGIMGDHPSEDGWGVCMRREAQPSRFLYSDLSMGYTISIWLFPCFTSSPGIWGSLELIFNSCLIHSFKSQSFNLSFYLSKKKKLGFKDQGHLLILRKTCD